MFCCVVCFVYLPYLTCCCQLYGMCAHLEYAQHALALLKFSAWLLVYCNVCFKCSCDTCVFGQLLSLHTDRCNLFFVLFMHFLMRS
jgi:hypothetical protein